MIQEGDKAQLITSCEISGFYDDNKKFPSNCGVQLVLNIAIFKYPENDSQ